MKISPRETATVDQLIDDLRPLGRPASPATMPANSPRPRSRLRPIRPPMRPAGVRACVALGVALGVAMPAWPYARDCGLGLFMYMTSTGVLVIAGIWGLRISWKSRLGFAHTVAMGTMLWGLALTADAVLPRVGYARNAAAWTCAISKP